MLRLNFFDISEFDITDNKQHLIKKSEPPVNQINTRRSFLLHKQWKKKSMPREHVMLRVYSYDILVFDTTDNTQHLVKKSEPPVDQINTRRSSHLHKQWKKSQFRGNTWFSQQYQYQTVFIKFIFYYFRNISPSLFSLNISDTEMNFFSQKFYGHVSSFYFLKFLKIFTRSSINYSLPWRRSSDLLMSKIATS